MKYYQACAIIVNIYLCGLLVSAQETGGLAVLFLYFFGSFIYFAVKDK